MESQTGSSGTERSDFKPVILMDGKIRNFPAGKNLHEYRSAPFPSFGVQDFRR